MGSAYAFSPFGFTGMYAGFGDPELARSNTAIKYRLDFMNFRVAGLAQIGGYDQGNGSASMWQGQIGGDFNLFGGVLSLDGVGSYAKDGVVTSIFNGTCAVLTTGPFAGQTGCVSGVPNFYNADDLKATLSNNTGVLLLAKYAWGAVNVFCGYEYFRNANPSDDYPNGFKTIGGYNVPGNIIGNKNFPTVWITANAFDINRIYNVFWGGAKYAVNDKIDLIGAVYYGQQNNFSTTPCTGRASIPAAPPAPELRCVLVPGRLSAGPTRRSVRRGCAVERLSRPRERIPADPEHRSDGGPAHQILKTIGAGSSSAGGRRSGKRVVFMNFLDLRPVFLLCSNYRWIEARLNAPDGKRPHPPRIGETEGMNSKTGIVRYSSGMKGWRQSASRRPEPDRAPLKRTYFCRTSDRSACLFSRVLGSPRGTPLAPFVAPLRLAAAESDKCRRTIRDHSMAPALRLPNEAGGTENEDRRTEDEPGANTQLAAFEAGTGSKIKMT